MRKISFKENEISSFCLGCLNFGTKTDKETSFKIMDKFIDEGGNFLDTANNYAFWNKGASGGESEKVIGEWLSNHKGRDKIFLATKCGAMPNNTADKFSNVEGLSKKAIFNAVDNSLLRLKTDYIDLCYAHVFDKNVSQEETLYAFNELIKMGKIRYIGCSNYNYDQFEESIKVCKDNGLEEYSFIQNRYSYLKPNKDADFGVQKCFDDEFLEHMIGKEDKLLLGYSPLLYGYYYKKSDLKKEYINSSVERRMARLEKVAKELNVASGQLVLAWMIQNNPMVQPLIAASSLEQLEINMKSQDIVLSKEQLDYLNEL